MGNKPVTAVCSKFLHCGKIVEKPRDFYFHHVHHVPNFKNQWVLELSYWKMKKGSVVIYDAAQYSRFFHKKEYEFDSKDDAERAVTKLKTGYCYKCGNVANCENITFNC